jgi:hypothetical protein
MKCIILGGGWYGNFLGLIFKMLNVEFIILEIKNDIFTGSSSKNQNRLHQGYHYPRSQQTRDECIIGYNLFVRLFGFMTDDINNNYYLLDKKSTISYEEYKKIYDNYGKNMGYKQVDNVTGLQLNMENIDGIVNCKEKLINHNIAYKYFKKILIDNTILNYDINKLVINDNKIYYDGKKYDYLINCTYGQMFKNPQLEYEYELCISFIYKSNINCALTLMDGPFFSIYPYTHDKYTLTDVEYTPIKKSKYFNDIILFHKNLTLEMKYDIKLKIEGKVKKYLPHFDNIFTYDSSNISYKCKFKNNDDDRSVKFYKDNNILSFVGGKITGIFGMAKIVCDELFEDKDGKLLNEVYDMIVQFNMKNI